MMISTSSTGEMNNWWEKSRRNTASRKKKRSGKWTSGCARTPRPKRTISRDVGPASRICSCERGSRVPISPFLYICVFCFLLLLCPPTRSLSRNYCFRLSYSKSPMDQPHDRYDNWKVGVLNFRGVHDYSHTDRR